MHGRACEDWKRGRPMLRAPSRATACVKTIGSSASTFSSPNSLLKDGRKITTGDCALFKPSQDYPPLIGIIRSVTPGIEKQIKLGVNWLYRPAEVKTGKGILFKAAPNEVFYSFHTDEVSAASLLHPCKVAFLPKGVELPSGIWAFVCRRVYDIDSKCLWWLTDQDYIDERQEEVDHLLYKTRLEMHATVQPGGHSPKPTNSPATTPQSNLSSDSVQNMGSSFPSQVKGKKRERADQGSEPVKRERISRYDDGDSAHSRFDSNLKSEISKITDKGALVDSPGVEKLIQLMSREKSEKKIDLVTRAVLAGVVAATEKFDCLNRFVQLRGLRVFDDWLQEVHKGKLGDIINSKDGERSIEQFLFVLLHALDKLPINLHALQMCNIGKSVNHLRSHKNTEIQRKARSLVDTWKKRVEAEMDAKSGSNQSTSSPAKPRILEPSHGPVKMTVVQSHASKSSPAKLIQGENNTKTAPLSTSTGRPALASGSTNLKEAQPKITAIGCASDIPSTGARDERSSSSSQSLNNSQTCSSDLGKTGGLSGKESKNSSGSSRLRKSMNGFQGSAPSTIQRDTGLSRSSPLQKSNNVNREILLQPSLTSEKAADVSVTEGNSHKLIVKITNRGTSPSQSPERRASSPVLSEKTDQVDHNSREKSETNRANNSSDVNSELLQNDDINVQVTGSDVGVGSPCVGPDGERSSSVNETMKISETREAASPPSAKKQKPAVPHEQSFTSINALIESCVKYSEENASLVIGDNVGMNLLASVAAGEISRSDTVSPTSSSRVSENCIPQNKSKNVPNCENEKQHDVNGDMGTKDAESNTFAKRLDNVGGSLESSVKHAMNKSSETSEKSENDIMHRKNALSFSSTEKKLEDDGNKQLNDVKLDDVLVADHVSDSKPEVASSLVTNCKIVDSSMKVECEATEKPLLNPLSEMGCGIKKEQKPPCTTPEFVRGTDEAPTPSRKKADELETKKTDVMEATGDCDPTKYPKIEGDCAVNGVQITPGLDSSISNIKAAHVGEKLDGNGVTEQPSVEPSPSNKPSLVPVKEREHSGVDEAEESMSIPGDASSVSVAGGSEMDSKVEFDLNEGFSGDDGGNGDLNNSTVPVASTSAPVQVISPLPLPASVTVAAAAKGPFVPPEDLLRNKVAHGWKGSAATSAFRPAEPRKAPELPNNYSSSRPDSTPNKQARPPLDIDLNIPDERVLEDLAFRTSDPVTSSVSSHTRPVRSGLDLDLNRVDEPADICNITCNNSHRLESLFQPVKPPTGNHTPNKTGAQRGFDLNNGPIGDDINSEPSMIFGQHARSMPLQPSFSGIRMNGAGEMGNFVPWFPGAGNTYSSVTVPASVLPDRGDHQPIWTQRMSGSAATPSPYSSDLYRGAAPSSSPAMSFPSATQFQYPVFPFGNNFSLPLTTFSAGSGTYIDSSTAGRFGFPPVSSHQAVNIPLNYPRPYVVNLTDGNSNSSSSESNRRWFRQDLDLNSGPETEGRTEAFSLAPRPMSASSSQSLTEEQARMFQLSGGVVKRKEPDGRWDGYKQSSWQQ